MYIERPGGEMLHRLPPLRLPPPHVLALGAIVLLAVALRAAWVAYVNIDPADGRFDDSVFYYNVAGLLADGEGYADPYGRGPTAQWPPAYPVLLAPAFAVFGKGLIAAKAVNIGLAAVAVVLTYLIGARLFDRPVGLLGALAVALLPSHIYFSTLVMAENMFVPAFLLALLLMIAWGLERTPSPRGALLVGAAIAFAGLVRSEGLWLVVPAAGLFLLRSPRWLPAARHVALIGVGVVLVLTPWTVRNLVQLDDFVPVRTASALSLAIGLHPDYEYFGNVILVQGERQYFTEAPLPTIADDLRIYRDEPWQPFAILGRKTAQFFNNDYGSLVWINNGPADELSAAETEVWRNVANAYYFSAGALALAGLAIAFARQPPQALLLAGVVATWVLGFALFLPESRYHLPLLPIAGLFAAVAAVSLLPGAARAVPPPTRAVSRLAAPALAAAVALAVLTPVFDYGEQTLRAGEQPARILALGEPIRMGDLVVTAREFRSGPDVAAAAAPPGYTWLAVDVSIRNAGAEAILLLGPAQAGVVDANETVYTLESGLSGAFFENAIAPEQSVDGPAVFAVPEGAGGFLFVFRAAGVGGEALWALE
jgi:4-amino-4-deoxy-L-arabinose transferase-like glycosyltransferase